MKREVIYISLAICLIFLIKFQTVNGDIYINDSMTVSADIMKPIVAEQIISVSVPDFIDLGNVTKGSSTPKVKIEINNTGNVDIKVTPILKNSSENIFSYLYFGSSVCTNSCQRIGDYSINIDKPTTGSSRNVSFYMKLDLTNYNDTINNDMIDYQTELIFVAMPQ